MIKKLFKFLCISMLVLCVLAAAGLFALYKMYPPSKLKAMAQTYVAQNFQREIAFEDISFTWIGFTLREVALSENNTFADGTFMKAKRLTAHVAVKPLLKKRVEISTLEADGLEINLIHQKDGSFNFDTLLRTDEQPAKPQENSPQEEQIPFILTAEKIALTGCNILYQDLQSGMHLALNDINFEIRQFDLKNPFEAEISFTTDISGTGQPDMKLPVSLQATVSLADLDFAQAYAQITRAQAQYKTITLQVQGEVKNWNAPDVQLTGSISGIDNTVLSDFAPDLPAFTLPALYLTLQATANLDASTARINLAKLTVQDSSLSINGNVGWGGQTPTYTLGGTLLAYVDQLVKMTSSANSFNPAGVIRSSFQATQKNNYQDVKGTVTLQNLSALYPPLTFSETNATLTVASLNDISAPNITGRLNGEKFNGSFSYQNVRDVLSLILKVHLDKLVLENFGPQTDAPEQPASAAAPTTSKTQSTLRLNVQADVEVGGVQIPYVESEGFTASARLTDLSDTLAHTNGTLVFNLQPGRITHLDNFVKASKTAKIILLPLTIVKKVAGFLSIDLFPSTSQAAVGTIAFTQGTGSYTFTDGVMTIDNTQFDSSVTHISASGTANFQTDALNMKATATLLSQAAPVNFKITGTMTDPKGKLDVLNTVGSVVGNLLNGTTVKSAAKGSANLTKDTAQSAGDAVKNTLTTATDVVKGIGSLFNKKADQTKQ